MILYIVKSPLFMIDHIKLEGSPIYSGHGDGLNNPDKEAEHNVGPIPAGLWNITGWRDQYGSKGPCVAFLAPFGHDAHGRSGFLIHGDNAALNFTASDGCIIAPRPVRERLRASGQTRLMVSRQLEAFV